MLRGLATVSLFADDLREARRWYADQLGIEPDFEMPGADGYTAYVDFRVGVPHNPHYSDVLTSTGQA